MAGIHWTTFHWSLHDKISIGELKSKLVGWVQGKVSWNNVKNGRKSLNPKSSKGIKWISNTDNKLKVCAELVLVDEEWRLHWVDDLTFRLELIAGFDRTLDRY